MRHPTDRTDLMLCETVTTTPERQTNRLGWSRSRQPHRKCCCRMGLQPARKRAARRRPPMVRRGFHNSFTTGESLLISLSATTSRLRGSVATARVWVHRWYGQITEMGTHFQSRWDTSLAGAPCIWFHTGKADQARLRCSIWQC